MSEGELNTVAVAVRQMETITPAPVWHRDSVRTRKPGTTDTAVFVLSAVGSALMSTGDNMSVLENDSFSFI